MVATRRMTDRMRLAALVPAIAALMLPAMPWAEHALARQETRSDGTAISVVHGLAGAGPLDVYLDGAIALIGIGFGDVSGELAIDPGEHELAVAPSGAGPDAAIAEGDILLDDGAHSLVALLGTVEEASVGLYAINERPVEAGRARLRVISGVVDAGEVTPAFTGGDALSEPLGFGDASQYAAIDAGVYDLDMLDVATGAVLLSLPQTAFGEGTVTDVVLLGQVSDGTLQALVNATSLQTETGGEWIAGVFSGGCGPDGPAVADLGVVQIGQGESVGVESAPPAAQGFGLAPVSFATLIGSPHAVAVIETVDPASGSPLPLACGEIGGSLTDSGALVITLQASHSEAPEGVAVLAPSLDSPDATGVSIFLTGFRAEETAEDREAAID